MGIKGVLRVVAVLLPPSLLGLWAAVLLAIGTWDLLRGPVHHIGGAVGLVASLVFAVLLVVGWRFRLANAGWVQAAAQFRDIVNGLQPVPVFYVNDASGVIFGYQETHNLWGRTQFLHRIPEADAEAVFRTLHEGRLAVSTAEEFQLRSGTWLVFRSVVGEQLRRTGHHVTIANPEGCPGRVRGTVNRYQALVAGLLHANELELRQVCAELASARPIHPNASA